MSVPVVIYLTVVMMLTAQGETLAHLKFSANPLSPWLQYLGFRIGLSVQMWSRSNRRAVKLQVACLVTVVEGREVALCAFS